MFFLSCAWCCSSFVVVLLLLFFCPPRPPFGGVDPHPNVSSKSLFQNGARQTKPTSLLFQKHAPPPKPRRIGHADPSTDRRGTGQCRDGGRGGMRTTARTPAATATGQPEHPQWAPQWHPQWARRAPTAQHPRPANRRGNRIVPDHCAAGRPVGNGGLVVGGSDRGGPE